MSWRMVFVVFAVYAVGTNSQIMAGILPAVADGLGITESIAGLGLTVFALTYALVGPFLPIVLSRFERRTIMAGSLVLFIGGTVLSGLAPDVVTFMLSRALVAVAAAAIAPQAAAIAIAISPPESQGRALGVLAAGMLLGIATGVPLGSLLALWLGGYSGAFLFLACLGIAGLVGIVLVPRTNKPAKATAREQFAPFRRPAVLVLGACAVLFAWCHFSVLTFFAPIMKSSAGISDTQLPILLMTYGLAGVLAAASGGRLIDRFGGFQVAIAGFIGITLMTPLFSVAWNFAAAAAVVIIWSVAQNVTFPAAQVEMGRLHPANPATVFALYAALVQAGGAMGAAASAAVLDEFGPQWIAPTAAIATLVGAAVMSALAYRLKWRAAADAETCYGTNPAAKSRI